MYMNNEIEILEGSSDAEEWDKAAENMWATPFSLDNLILFLILFAYRLVKQQEETFDWIPKV